MIRFIIFFMAMFFLAACSDDDNAEPPAELIDFEQTLEINELWSVDTGVGVGQLFIKLFPLILDDRVVVTDRDGNVTAFDLQTGDKLWSTSLDITVSGGVGGNNRNLVITGRNGHVVLLDAKGQLVWKVDASSEVLMPAQIAGNLIIIRSVNGQISALSVDDGSEQWAYKRDVPALTLRGNSVPMMKQGYIFNGLDNGRLVTLDLLDGRVVFDIAVASPAGRSELERLVDIDGHAEIAKDTLYMASYQGRVISLDIRRGQLNWSRKLSTFSGVSYSTSGLFISDDKDAIWALETSNGATLWKQEKLKARQITRPINIGQSIVVGDFEGYLHFLSPFDGHFQARIDTDGSGIIVPPIEHNGRLYVITRGGELSVFSLEKTDK